MPRSLRMDMHGKYAPILLVDSLFLIPYAECYTAVKCCLETFKASLVLIEQRCWTSNKARTSKQNNSLKLVESAEPRMSTAGL